MASSSVTKKALYGAFSFLLVLFLTHKILFFQKGLLENLSSAFIYPVMLASKKAATPFRNFLSRRAQYRELEAKLEQLEKENVRLLSKNCELEAKINRFKGSKDLVLFQDRYNLAQGILSKVVIKNFTPYEHAFFIDKGSADGVRKNMIAVHDAQLVGRVNEVFPYYSKIILLSDQSCKVAAYLTGSSVSGIAMGKNSINSCSLDYVSHLMTIKDDDLVISSGEGLIFPEGFCIGRVSAHTIEGLCHSITIKPIIDFTKLEFCVLLDRSLLQNF